MNEEPRHEKGHGGRYVLALVILLVLTGVSFGLAQAPLGGAGPAVALTIAAVKVVLVAAVFMHLSEAVFATRLVGVATALFIALLCLGIVADVGFR